MAITVTVTDGIETVSKTVSNPSALRIRAMMLSNLGRQQGESDIQLFMRFLKEQTVGAVFLHEKSEAANAVGQDPLLLEDIP